MVEDRVTDPVRIAQLLSSELSGRDDGPLGDVAVVDADRDAQPSPDGTVAYGVAVRGTRIADVVLLPDRVEVVVTPDDPAAVAEAVRGPGVFVKSEDDGRSGRSSRSNRPGRTNRAGRSNGSDRPARSDGERSVVVGIGHGAAVKRAVDALVAGFPR